MGCTTSLVRCILIVFNTLMVLLSITCVGVGIFVVVAFNKFFELLTKASEQIGNNNDVSEEIKRISEQSDIVRATGFVLIGLGSLVLLISVLGCIGACKESKCLLITYSTFVGLLAAAKIALVVVAIIYRPNLEDLMKKSLKELQDNFFLSINEIADVKNPVGGYSSAPKELKTTITQLINYMQVALDCCGAIKEKDIAESNSWLESNLTWSENVTMAVPATCCPVQDNRKGDLLGGYRFPEIKDFLVDVNCPVTQKGINTALCLDKASALIETYMWISIGAFGGLILLEILLVVFSICIVCSAKDEKIARHSRY